MPSPERTLGIIRGKLARGGTVSVPYRAPSIDELMRRIDQALAGR